MEKIGGSLVSVFTVFGARGFIGSALVHQLRRTGHAVRTAEPDGDWRRHPLGHVIYAVGLTADFRKRPLAVGEAHVGLCSRILTEAGFDSFLYLSSARVYQSSSMGREDAAFIVDPRVPDQVYDLSKLAGESLCLNSRRQGVRVARLSNVVGPGDRSDNFLASVIRDAIDGHVTLHTHPESTKDYVLLDDVVRILPEIALRGTRSVYNVASGVQVSHRDLLARLVERTGCTWDVSATARRMDAAPVDITRLREEFRFRPTPVLERIDGLVDESVSRPEPAPRTNEAVAEEAPVA